MALPHQLLEALILTKVILVVFGHNLFYKVLVMTTNQKSAKKVHFANPESFCDMFIIILAEEFPDNLENVWMLYKISR